MKPTTFVCAVLAAVVVSGIVTMGGIYGQTTPKRICDLPRITTTAPDLYLEVSAACGGSKSITLSDIMPSYNNTCSTGKFVSGSVTGVSTCTAISPSYIANPPSAFNSAFLISDNSGVGQWGTMTGDVTCNVPSANSMSCTLQAIKGVTLGIGTPTDHDLLQYRPAFGWANFSNALASATFQNQGTTGTLLHGNAAGNPTWAPVADGELANAYSGIGTCTNQVPTAFTRNAAPACTSLTTAFLPTTARGWTYTAPNLSLSTSTDSVAIGASTPTARLEITSNTAVLPTPPTGTLLHLGNADTTNSRITLDSFGTSALPGLAFRRSLGTAASRTALGSANTFGSLYWQGAYDSTNFSGDVAQIGCETAEAFTSSAQGTNCFLSTVHTGGTTLERRWVIDSAGHEVVATTTTPPTVACTGTGTSPTAPSIAGTDLAFTINMPTGTGSPSNTGTCTITFGTAFITNMPVLICTLQNGASAWGIGSGVMVSAKSLTAPVLTWWDEVTGVLTGLTVSSSYQISCRVTGKAN